MRHGLHRARKALISFLATIAVVAAFLISGGTPAMAGSNGQQVRTVVSNNVNGVFNWLRISGQSQNGWADTGYRYVNPWCGGPSSQCGYELYGWWWKGQVKVEVWDYYWGKYRWTMCNVPVSNPYGDWHNCYPYYH